LKGVKGRLYFFCFILGILNPIFFLINYFFITTPQGLLTKYSGDATLQVSILVGLGIDIGMVLFGFITAYKLWKVDPNAPKIAKIFLIAQLIFGLIGLLFSIDKNSIRAVLSAIIWLWYFNVSKRVKATFNNT
jgi:hypothetical protein